MLISWYLVLKVSVSAKLKTSASFYITNCAYKSSFCAKVDSKPDLNLHYFTDKRCKFI
ncbi:hypothetical protein JCM10003_2559 [Bacteroides pyogenes JCM 10003]|nr:hypothetical protein JCM10003_2559 [Bacteroides pyogenes JCM 10003]